PVRGVLSLTPEVRPEPQPLGDGGVEDRLLLPTCLALPGRCQVATDHFIQDRAVDPGRDLGLLGWGDPDAHGIERPPGLEARGTARVETPPVDRPEEPRRLRR